MRAGDGRLRGAMWKVGGGFLTIAMAVTAPAFAEPSCPIAQIGQPCTGSTTCVQATCSKLQSGGGYASSTCGVCTYVGGAYCLPADVDKPCGDGGICTFQGGSSGATDGNGATQSYGLQTCNAPVDAGGGSSSGTIGPSCPPEDDGKPCDGGGVCMIYGGSSSSGGSGGTTVSTAACVLPGSGSSSGSIGPGSASSSGGTSNGVQGSSSGSTSSSTGSASSSTGSSSGSSSSGSGSSSGVGSRGSGSSGGSPGDASASSSGDIGSSGGGSMDLEGGLDDAAVATSTPTRNGGCSISPSRPSEIFGWLAMISVTALLWRRRSC